MTYEQLPLIMLRALTLTVVIEVITAWVFGVKSAGDQIVVVLANLMTNPLVVSFGAAAAVFIGHQVLLPFTIAMEIIAIKLWLIKAL